MRWLMQKGAMAIPSTFSKRALQNTTVPTLILIGDEETLYKDANKVFQRAIDNMPNVETLTVPNAGHVSHYDNPEFVNDAMIRFFLK